MIADGGTTISQIDTLRHQGELFGSVASDTTVWRALEEITSGRLGTIAAARARVREHVWKQVETDREPAWRHPARSGRWQRLG